MLTKITLLSTTLRYHNQDLRHVDLQAFHSDVRQSPLYHFDSATSVDSYVELFSSEVQQILDKHVPLKSWTRHAGQNDCRWLLAEARDAKRCCRRHERRYRRTKSTSDRPVFHAAWRTAREAITRSRSYAIRQRFDDVSGNSATTWRVVREVLHTDHRPVHTTVSVVRSPTASVATSQTSWNAFTNRSQPACSRSLIQCSMAADTRARCCHSCHPLLPVRCGRC